MSLNSFEWTHSSLSSLVLNFKTIVKELFGKRFNFEVIPRATTLFYFINNFNIF